MQEHVHTSTYMLTHTRTHACKHTDMRAHARTHAHTHTHTHASARSHTVPHTIIASHIHYDQSYTFLHRHLIPAGGRTSPELCLTINQRFWTH